MAGFDPCCHGGRHPRGKSLCRKTNAVVNGARLWRGKYEDAEREWLRWCDRDGKVIPTGAERATGAEQRAKEEQQARVAAEQRAQAAEELAARLAEQLRQKGNELGG
jgi:hypothetical protein